jgi:hypothetical protein
MYTVIIHFFFFFFKKGPYKFRCLLQRHFKYSKSITLAYRILISFYFLSLVMIFCQILTEICEITKILLIIFFFIFLFNLTAIFNGMESILNETKVRYTKIRNFKYLKSICKMCVSS